MCGEHVALAARRIAMARIMFTDQANVVKESRRIAALVVHARFLCVLACVTHTYDHPDDRLVLSLLAEDLPDASTRCNAYKTSYNLCGKQSC